MCTERACCAGAEIERGSGGIERRFLNNRGHKMNTQLDYAQKRKSLVTSYRIPAFNWLEGWYTFAASAYDEQTDYIDLRNFKLIASRSGEINEHWTAIASINVTISADLEARIGAIHQLHMNPSP